MNSRMNDNLLKVVFFMLMCVMLLLQTFFAGAQTSKGLDVAFGWQRATIDSDIAQIDEKQLLQVGAAVGFHYGNNNLSSHLSAGYYSSAQNCPGTLDRYALAARVKVFPLSWLTDKSHTINPYITTGVSYDHLRFYGFYISREPGITNWSQAEAPYLGSINQVNAGLGAGLSVAIFPELDFIRLYSEVWYRKNLSSQGSDHAFNNTALENQMQISLGLSVGAVR